MEKKSFSRRCLLECAVQIGGAAIIAGRLNFVNFDSYFVYDVRYVFPFSIEGQHLQVHENQIFHSSRLLAYNEFLKSSGDLIGVKQNVSTTEAHWRLVFKNRAAFLAWDQYVTQNQLVNRQRLRNDTIIQRRGYHLSRPAAKKLLA